MAADNEDLYYVADETIEEDIGGDFNEKFLYEGVDVEDPVSSEEEGDENLEIALKLIKQHNKREPRGQYDEASRDVCSKLTQWPEVVEDFVRNYLMKMGMLTTLDCFQVEWYRLKETGQLQESSSHSLPDVYHQNRQLIKQIELLKEDIEKYKRAALNAKNQFVKLKKERDYHRMHHRRVFQEKEKVLKDIKRLKDLFSQHKEVLEKTRQKFENAAREKTIAQVENQRLRMTCKLLQQSQGSNGKDISGNETHVMSMGVREVLGSEKLDDVPQNRQPDQGESQGGQLTADAKGNGSTVVAKGDKPTVVAKRDKSTVVAKGDKLITFSKVEKSSPLKDAMNEANQRTVVRLPVDMANPYKCMEAPRSTHTSKEGGWSVSNSIQAHDYAISGLCLHPRKSACVTGSDDHNWKMWSLPGCEILMSGTGHKDWIGGVQISPNGVVLATCSGDGTVKLWNFREGSCVCTFQDHQQPVWECSWHSCGDYLATASMDHTVKIWDVQRDQCVSTLRGHADSVNSAEFLAYSNVLCTCSADKTVSLWDIRSNLCIQTFFGHSNSCNSASPTLKGDIVASCDSFGHVFLWDLRGSNSLAVQDLGPHSINAAAFDPSGELLGLASSDGSVKLMNIITGKVDLLCGHEDQVQNVVFAQDGSFALSSSTNGHVIVWQ